MVNKNQQEILSTVFGLYDADGLMEPLLIPARLAEQIEVERLERMRLAIEEDRRERAERAVRTFEEEERLKRGGSFATARSLSPLQAALALTVPEELPPRPPNTVAVFDWDAARERFESLKTRAAMVDKEMIARDLRHFAKAMAEGPWRTVIRPSGWRQALGLLAAEMPNFADVVEAIQRALALAELTERPAALQPILLLGAPGVGKTHFTQRLAEALQTPIHRQPFDNAQTNSALRGSDRHWANSTVGALWDLVVLGNTANPVVLLDELDKGAHSGTTYRPVEALLSLLEPITASKVKDVSIDFEFDASHVVYVATANDANSISAPVRSRFLEFFIDEPDIDGRLILAHSIFQATLKRMVPKDKVRSTFAQPTDLQICRLAWMTPRQIRMAVERALGAAAYEGRCRFEDRDFNVPEPRTKVSGVLPNPKGGGDDLAVFVVRS